MVKSFLALPAIQRPGIRCTVRLLQARIDFHTRLRRVAATGGMSHSRFREKEPVVTAVSPGGNTMTGFCRWPAWGAAAVVLGAATAGAQTGGADPHVTIL